MSICYLLLFIASCNNWIHTYLHTYICIMYARRQQLQPFFAPKVTPDFVQWSSSSSYLSLKRLSATAISTEKKNIQNYNYHVHLAHSRDWRSRRWWKTEYMNSVQTTLDRIQSCWHICAVAWVRRRPQSVNETRIWRQRTATLFKRTLIQRKAGDKMRVV